MSSSTTTRWAFLLSALGATIVASFYPTDRLQDGPLSVASVPERPSATAARPRVARPATAVWSAPADDPFAPRVWTGPVAAAPVDTRHVETVETAQAPAELPPPPLPYKFLGQMRNGGEHILYLGRGEQVLLAQKGDILENSYKVLDVSDAQIEFETVQSGIRQSLSIPAQ